ncbi:MAG: polysaccharide biosynthesis protein [Clostridia bacterium]|nr:polysaccharide biosynthesis protein [Clostridia bacterium]
MRRQSVLLGALLLALGGIIAKFVGALYKIPLTNILGTNGMGLYYLVFPLYTLLFVFTSSGVGIAVSRLVSFERINHNKKNELTILKTSIIYVFVLSFVFAILLIFLSEEISVLQGDINARFGYLAIAPSIIFSSLIAVIRGYFQGQENMVPTLLNNVVEQIVKLIAGLVLANLFLAKGVTFAVFGAILGVTISEFFALLFIILNYVFYKKRLVYKIENAKTENLTILQALKKLLAYAYPATLSSIVLPITAFLDSFLVINILKRTGFSTIQATNMYGISNGIVNTLINLPILLCSSLATAIVPNLSGLYAQNNGKEVSFKTSFFIKITWLIAIPCFLVFMIFSPDIISILYSRGLSDLVIDEFSFAYKLLMISSVSIIYNAFLQTFTSILQSFGRPFVPFVSLFASLIIRMISLNLFVSNASINIFGVAISNLLFLSVACIINLIYIRRYIKIKFETYRMLVVPLASAVVSGISMYFLRLMLINTNVIFYCIVSAGVGMMVYIGMIVLFKSFDREEMTVFRKKNLFNSKRKV